MTALIAALLLSPLLVRQQPTVTATVSGSTITVAWTAPVGHPLNEWIALYRVGAPLEPFPSSLYWRFVPAGGTGEPLVFPIPGTGEWEARYLSGGNATLATSPKLMIAPGDDPAPDPTPLPPIEQTRRVIQIVITRADGTVETRGAEEHTNYANPAQAALERVAAELGVGDTAEVREWVELIVIPTRTPDRIWRVRVNKVLP